MGCGVSKNTTIDVNRRRPKITLNDVNSETNHLISKTNTNLPNNVNHITGTVNSNIVSGEPATSIFSTATTTSTITTTPGQPKVRKLQRQLSRIDELAAVDGINNNNNILSQLSEPQDFSSIACQTEFIRNSVMTQTDPLPTPEEELEMLINCEYELPESFNSSHQSDINCDTSTTALPSTASSSTIMVIPSTRAKRNSLGGFFEDFEISKETAEPESKMIDVAIQVVQVRNSCSTQTNYANRGSAGGPHSGGTLKSASDSLEDTVLFRRVSQVDRLDREAIANQDLGNISPTRIWAELSSSSQNGISSIDNINISSHQSDNNMPTIVEPKLHDFESQTDPVTEVFAANAGDNDLNVLQSFNLSSPFSHIEKQLGDPTGRDFSRNAIDNRLQECLNKLLDDMEDSLNFSKTGSRKDASVQTVNDPITDEAPEFAARPPPSRKKEMIPNLSIFKEIDAKALETPEEGASSLVPLVNYLTDNLPNDMFKVRGIFRWIAHNIKYNWNYMGVSVSSDEILRTREGVCKDYCQLFGDMCLVAGIRCKKIQGFAKGYDYRPGHQFRPGEDVTHSWNAVFILGSWRFIDLTWGTGYTDHSGKFQRKLNEHFFLTDPETMIWTHFPFNELESNYSRWQLLDKPLTLEEFNMLPKVTPYFFEYNLKIRSKLANPISFRVQTEIKIGAHEPMRYKYKLYPADEVENASLNHYVFCQLKEDRMVGSFLVTPPIEGRYFLKIYARPEKDMTEWSLDATISPTTSTNNSQLANLHSCVTFLIECTRARKYLQPYPLNELPWGPTQSFYDFKMRLLNQNGPVVTTWGGKRRLILESSEPMLITYQVLDSEGMEMDAKNLLIREDTGNRTTFIISPPRLGMFKLMIFGMPKPKQKGKWRLPLLATFLIECKMAKIAKQLPEEEDPPPVVVDYAEPQYEPYTPKFSKRSIIR